MAHVDKYTRGSCGGLTKHYERAKDEQGRYYRFKNEEIDPSRTHLNYNLAPHNEKQLEFIKKRLSEANCLKREDVKVMCSWIVTAPQELPEEHEREFFERSYRFLEKRYGKENVISAYVHMDETSPHMHFAFVPAVYDRKKGREKVSAKEVLTKSDLKAFHGDLQAEMDKFCEAHDYEFECNVLNGATENGNHTVQGLKAKKLATRNEIEMEFLEQVIERTNEETEKLEYVVRKRESLENDIKNLKAEKSTLEGNLSALEGKIGELKTELAELEAKKNISEYNLFKKFLDTFPKVKEAFERWCMGIRQQERSRLDEFKAIINREYKNPQNRQENAFKGQNNVFEQSERE